MRVRRSIVAPERPRAHGPGSRAALVQPESAPAPASSGWFLERPRRREGGSPSNAASSSHDCGRRPAMPWRFRVRTEPPRTRLSLFGLRFGRLSNHHGNRAVGDLRRRPCAPVDVVVTGPVVFRALALVAVASRTHLPPAAIVVGDQGVLTVAGVAASSHPGDVR